MDRDLLPWILGGALITTAAIAAAIQFTGHSPSAVVARTGSPAQSTGAGSGLAMTLPAAPAPESTPAAAAAPQIPPSAPPASAPPPSASAASTASTASELPAGEVWQCVVNGQKVFSDKRCGSGASVRQLGDVNVMDAPSAPPQTSYGMYPPGYGGAAYPPSYPGDQDEAESAGDFYPGQQIIVARERARRERLSRRDNPARSPPPGHGAAGSRLPR